MSVINEVIQRPKTRIHRKVEIKRRLATTGLFESEWQDITPDVEKWGKVKTSVDFKRQNKLKFNNMVMKLSNDTGRYNFEDDRSSLWFGYANQQRTLFRVTANFIDQVYEGGIWRNTPVPGDSFFDQSLWDASLWDDTAFRFIGLLQGDVNYTDNNSVSLSIKPLNQVFIDYPAQRLTGWTTTGMTASDFCGMLRDQTDGSSNFIFRPFFGDTTTNWEISPTTNNYANLNTSSAKDVIDKNVWDVLERLSEAEQFVPYVTSDGKFKFISKFAVTSSGYEFHGLGYQNREYGLTIKKITRLNRKVTDLYTRVQVKFNDDDTETSYSVEEATLQVGGSNLPWNYGYRSFKIDNTWIANTAVADAIATDVFNDLSSLKKEVKFTTSFVPQLNVLEEVEVNYDSSEVSGDTLWNQNDWNTQLTWDAAQGDAISLLNAKFKLFSIAIDLDKLECEFLGREA